jgi:hypothetical protein
LSSKKILEIAIICMMIAFSVGIVSAESPPNLPVILYGNVNIDGKPASAGTTISAKAGDSLAGTTKVLTAGTYGDMANDMLPISAGVDGAMVDFYVNNIKATSATFKYYSEDAGKHFRIDLNVQTSQSGGTSGTSDKSGSGGSSSGGYGVDNVTNKGTATPSAIQKAVSSKEPVPGATIAQETPVTTTAPPQFEFFMILGVFVLLVIAAIIYALKKSGGK